MNDTAAVVEIPKLKDICKPFDPKFNHKYYPITYLYLSCSFRWNSQMYKYTFLVPQYVEDLLMCSNMVQHTASTTGYPSTPGVNCFTFASGRVPKKSSFFSSGSQAAVPGSTFIFGFKAKISTYLFKKYGSLDNFYKEMVNRYLLKSNCTNHLEPLTCAINNFFVFYLI